MCSEVIFSGEYSAALLGLCDLLPRLRGQVEHEYREEGDAHTGDDQVHLGDRNAAHTQGGSIQIYPTRIFMEQNLPKKVC